MKIESKIFEKKKLTEDGWIKDLPDGLEVRVDYQTRDQEAEQKKLQSVWEYGINTDKTQHPINHYLRSVCKELKGLTVDEQESVLVMKGDYAKSISFGKLEVDFIEFLYGTGIWDGLWIKASIILGFSETDKKKLSLLVNSIGQESSQENLSRTEQASLTPGSPSEQMEPTTE